MARPQSHRGSRPSRREQRRTRRKAQRGARRRERRARRGRPLWTVLVAAGVTGFLLAALLVRLQTTDEVVPPADPDVLARQQPAALPPPDGLELPPLGAGAAVATPRAPAAADPVDVAAVVRPLTDRRRVLGRRVHVSVAGLDGDPVVTVGSGTFIPASLTKLLTATAATSTLSSGARFETRADLLPGTGARPLLVLVGGGDPLLASRPEAGPGDLPVADLASLARDSARNLAASGTTTVRLRYDDTRFVGDGRNDAWPSSYYAGVTAPITALMVDQGRTASFGRASDPSLTTAQAYAAALREEGITVRGRPRPLAADALGGRVDATEPGAAPETVAEVRSAPLELMVRHMLETSDNTVAEVLAQQVAVAEGLTPDFAGGARATRDVLGRLGVPLDGLVLRDGSGLSRLNRFSPDTVIGVLRVAASADHPELRPVITGLPVAGFTGSLLSRFTDTSPAGLGVVRAKTGTLTGVHALAGTVVDREGTTMLFVAVADRVPVVRTLDARDLLAQITARLAACRCGDEQESAVG